MNPNTNTNQYQYQQTPGTSQGQPGQYGNVPHSQQGNQYQPPGMQQPHIQPQQGMQPPQQSGMIPPQQSGTGYGQQQPTYAQGQPQEKKSMGQRLKDDLTGHKHQQEPYQNQQYGQGQQQAPMHSQHKQSTTEKMKEKLGLGHHSESDTRQPMSGGPPPRQY